MKSLSVIHVLCRDWGVPIKLKNEAQMEIGKNGHPFAKDITLLSAQLGLTCHSKMWQKDTSKRSRKW